MRSKNVELNGIVTWLRSPAGEYWIDTTFEPALDPLISFRDEYGPGNELDYYWSGAWHPSNHSLKTWQREVDHTIRWMPDLGPEYTCYPQIKEAA